MTSTPDRPTDDLESRRRLASATDALRGRVNRRAVEVADDVLASALRSSRRSLPIRAPRPHHHVLVSDQVLISRLRQHIDQGVPGCAVGRVRLRANPNAALEEVTIELFVQYGEVLMDVSDQVRAIAGSVLAEILGSLVSTVDVVLTHVHVSDITVGDPQLCDPSDETPPR